MKNSNTREHPLTGERVILAPLRSARPNAFDHGGPRAISDPADCPFCPGNENQTPPEIARRGDDEAWRVRVIPNKYPALVSDGNGASGLHEVFIESPRHAVRFSALELREVQEVVETWIERYTIARSTENAQCVAIFKNEGSGSGQSIQHVHSQMIALSEVGDRLRAMESRFARHPCPLCALISPALRVIDENVDFVLLSPPAPRFAYETWIVPRAHSGSFESLREGHLERFASILASATRRVDHALGAPPYNMTVMNAPRSSSAFHWFVEIIPRLATLGGFELATGIYINIVDPDDAALALKGPSAEEGL